MVTKVKRDVNEELRAQRACGTCDHWDRLPDGDQEPGLDVSGECNWLPPKVLGLNEEGEVEQASPMTPYRHRCGQYQLKVN